MIDVDGIWGPFDDGEEINPYDDPFAIEEGAMAGWSASFGIGLNSSSPLVDTLAKGWDNKTIGIYLEPQTEEGLWEWSQSGEIVFG